MSQDSCQGACSVSKGCLGCLMLLAAFCTGCQRGDIPALAAQTPNDPTPTPKVSVVKPEPRKLKRSVQQPGSVRADLEAPLAANLTGYVRSVAVDIGDEVKEGQELVQIAVPELDEDAKQKDALVRQADMVVKQAKQGLLTAEAQVAAAEAFVKEAEAGYARAEANYKRWSSEAARMEALAKQKVVDDQTRDETLNQAKAADAARGEVVAKVNSAKAGLRKALAERERSAIDIQADEAKLDVAKAEAGRIKALLGYKSIRAPFDGIVTWRGVDPGHFLQPGKPDKLMVVASVGKVRVLIDVPETESALVRKGDAARIKIQALDNREITGTVKRMAWSLDSQARTLRVEIELTNQGGLLRPGMYVTANIAVDTPAVMAVPTKALQKAGETMACFVARDGKAMRLRVRAGRSDGEFTEVVQKQKADGGWEAFAGDEAIIANPPAGLKDGQSVDVEARSDK